MLLPALGLIVGLIAILYLLTLPNRDAIMRRIKGTLPGLKTSMEITLNAELQKISASKKITGEAAQFVTDLLKQVVDGRKNPSLLVSAIEERYPQALDRDLYGELLAVVNSSISSIATANKEKVDEVSDFEGDLSSVWSAITVFLWRIDLSEYNAIKNVYQTALMTATAQSTIASGTMPEVY
ncbi:MAG: hypothetical protein RL023_1 [Candidatus Parcubacteria bacterium]|jgi:hypothetical protein